MQGNRDSHREVGNSGSRYRRKKGWGGEILSRLSRGKVRNVLMEGHICRGNVLAPIAEVHTVALLSPRVRHSAPWVRRPACTPAALSPLVDRAHTSVDKWTSAPDGKQSQVQESGIKRSAEGHGR